MKIASAILFMSTIVLLMWACGDDKEVTTQRTAIESYFSRQGWDARSVDGIYRHVVNGDRDDYGNAAEAVAGDSLIFYFDIRTFSSSIATRPFFSNDPATIDTLVNKNGLNADYWPRGKRREKLGSSSLMKGLDSGLIRSREGDSILLFLTSDLAYDEDYASTVPENTAIVYTFYGIEVKKQ